MHENKSHRHVDPRSCLSCGLDFVSIEEVSAVVPSLKKTPWTNRHFKWYTFISCALAVKDLAYTSRNCWGEGKPNKQIFIFTCLKH